MHIYWNVLPSYKQYFDLGIVHGLFVNIIIHDHLLNTLYTPQSNIFFSGGGDGGKCRFRWKDILATRKMVTTVVIKRPSIPIACFSGLRYVQVDITHSPLRCSLDDHC